MKTGHTLKKVKYKITNKMSQATYIKTLTLSCVLKASFTWMWCEACV